MIGEGAPKSIDPSPEEVARIKAAQQEADPTTYSELSLDEDKVEMGMAVEGKENRLFSSNGETYVRLERGTEGAAQFVTSKLLKGILNASDVVKDAEGVFYSKVMPLDKIQAPTSSVEMDADLFILKALTGDGDHYFLSRGEGLAPQEKNLARSNERTAYFDFDAARRLNPAINTAEQAGYADTETLKAADEKLARIYARLNGTMGTLFLTSIIKESGLTVSEIFPAYQGVDNEEEGGIPALQASLLEKIKMARSEVNDRLGGQWEKAAA